MTARVLDGDAIAASIRERIAAAVAERNDRDLRPPGVAVLLVGDDPASEIYVRLKQRDCREVGFKHDIRHLSANTQPAELSAMIEELNADDSIDGILVQLPPAAAFRSLPHPRKHRSFEGCRRGSSVQHRSSGAAQARATVVYAKRHHDAP